MDNDCKCRVENIDPEENIDNLFFSKVRNFLPSYDDEIFHYGHNQRMGYDVLESVVYNYFRGIAKPFASIHVKVVNIVVKKIGDNYDEEISHKYHGVCYIQLPLWLMLPESPRWLISKGRVDEAKAIMTKGAKWNRKEVDLSGLIKPSDCPDKHNELGFQDLFSSKDILIITIVMFFNWPIITMGYFGLGLSMTQLGGNIFVDFILGALVEVNVKDIQYLFSKFVLRSLVIYCVLW